MAGGKLTPRQKMINLMYLVFIAMLALNMSKEVLSAFGLLNEKFEATNVASLKTNEGMLAALVDKGSKDPAFKNAKDVSEKVAVITKGFYNYIESLKPYATKGVPVENGKLNYEAMDKAPNIDDG